MKSKKFILFITIIICTFMFNMKSAFAINIKIEDVKIEEQIGSLSIEDIEYTDNSITSGIEFNDINDSATFKISLKNSEKMKYTIESITDNNTSDYLNITYNYDKSIESNESKDIYVTIKCTKKLVNKKNISLNDLTIKLNLIDEKGNKSGVDINPTTGDNIIKYIVLFIAVLILLLFSLLLIKRRKNKKILLLLLLLFPVVVFAKNRSQYSFSFTNIKINGEMLPYTISILDENGNITERTIKYGEKVGSLPEVTKDGYNFLKYENQDNEEVTANTVVTGDMTITPKFEIIEYSIEYNYDGGSATNQNKYTIEDEITLNNPTKLGYTFAGWTGSNGDDKQTRVTISHETGNKSYTANWSRNQNTPYKVIHRYPNLDGTYEVVTENLEGPTDENVTPGLLPKEGFTGPSNLTELTIVAVEDEADIPTVTYTYTRNQYNLTVIHPEYIQEGDVSDLYYYEQQVTLTAKTRDNYEFNKWSNNETNNPLTLTITRETSIEPLYTRSKYVITYNANGGEVSQTTQKVNVGESINSMPTPSAPIGKEFDGWYTELDGGIKITESYTPIDDMTLYAHWITNPFPIVFSHPGVCIFNGTDPISGENCEYAGQSYIDTNIPLYTSDNYGLDYEIGFTIESYDSTQNVKQATFVNAKYENQASGYPGAVVRKYETYDLLELSQTINGTRGYKTFEPNTPMTVKVYRISGILYYSINGGRKVEVQNMNNTSDYFTTTTWFGAAHTSSNGAQRQLKGTLSNMYIKLGTYQDDTIYYNVTYNANGGTVSKESDRVEKDTSIDSLPVPEKENSVFDGWYTEANGGTKIEAPYTPTDDITLYAHWRTYQTVFNHTGACTFNGTSTITGTNCEYAGQHYIDTGVALYTSDNYGLDYEIGFTIESYDSTQNVKQATFVNSKYENQASGYPGMVVRKYETSDQLEVAQTIARAKQNKQFTPSNPMTVRIYRIDGILYYSIDNGSRIEVQNIKNTSDYFSTTTWFGAAPTSSNGAQRQLKGTLSNMYIKILN